MMNETDKTEASPLGPGLEVQVEFCFRLRDEKGLILEFEDQGTIPGTFMAPNYMTMRDWVGSHNDAALLRFHRAIQEEAMRRAEEYREQCRNGTWVEEGPDAPPWHLSVSQWTQAQMDRAAEVGRLGDLSLRPEDVLAVLDRGENTPTKDWLRSLFSNVPGFEDESSQTDGGID